MHLVKELCEGGEIFDMIVARGHYSEHAAIFVTRTIVEVVQVCCRSFRFLNRSLANNSLMAYIALLEEALRSQSFAIAVFDCFHGTTFGYMFLFGF